MIDIMRSYMWLKHIYPIYESNIFLLYLMIFIKSISLYNQPYDSIRNIIIEDHPSHLNLINHDLLILDRLMEALLFILIGVQPLQLVFYIQQLYYLFVQILVHRLYPW